MQKLTNDDIDAMEGSNLLPKEQKMNYNSQRLDVDPKLRQLFRDLDLLDSEYVQEIVHRIQLQDLSKLLVVVKWKPEHWVRHLGSRTAWRLAEACYWLSCLSHLDGLVEYLEKASSNEGWVFTLTNVHYHAFELEIHSFVSVERWNQELCRAVKSEIECLGGNYKNPSTCDDTRDGSHWATWSNAKQIQSDNLILPQTSRAIRDVDTDKEQFNEVEEDIGERNEQNRENNTLKKRVLQTLFLLNVTSALCAIRYGFNVKYGEYFVDPFKSVPREPTKSPTSAP